MRKGSVTIVSLLSMMLVLSTLFALLEAGRFQEIHRLAGIQTQVGLESAFAEYNTYLWEEYRLLACHQKSVCDDFIEISNSRLVDDTQGTNFYQFVAEEIKMKACTRLTDGDGSAYIQAVATYMKENLTYETAKRIYEKYEEIEFMKNSSDFDISDIDEALNQMEKEESIASTGSTRTGGEDTKEDVVQEKKNVDEKNLLEIMKDLKKKGILYLVIEDTSQLSEKVVDLSKVVSKRKLTESYHPNLKESDWYEKVLLQQYFLTYMSNYLDNKKHSMTYELEYLLGGKGSDVENMKSVVNQLLGIREAANFMYLMSDQTKVELAGSMALAIVGITGNAAIIEAVKIAVLSAWAFAESILDIRTLLTGGKIALVKNDAAWTMDLEDISTLGTSYAKAKNSEEGLSYKEYLGILLLFQEGNQLAKRGMDVQELTLQEKYNNKEIYLDEWIIDTEIEVTYHYNPVFFSIKRILPVWNSEICVVEQYGY